MHLCRWKWIFGDIGEMLKIRNTRNKVNRENMNINNSV